MENSNIENELPLDWRKQALLAKSKFDCMNQITEVLIFPYKWREELFKLDENDHIFTHRGENSFLWGANVMFGMIDEPIAGGTPVLRRRYGVLYWNDNL